LIATMSRENRLWGTERIRGELLKLGIVVSNRSIRRYRWRGPKRTPSQTWRTFLANHAHHLWAADLFTVPTLNLLRDRDAAYGRDFRQRARRIGVDAITTPIHSPRANAVAERVIGTLRRECLDHIIVLNEEHLRSLLTEFLRYYNQDRPHRTLGLQTPEPRLRPTTGPIRARPVLNGLHHVYERVA
jgi:hypothetical protein